jgi:uroporphyrinogen-III synthase
LSAVWVTRDEPPGGPLAAALAAQGLAVVHEPVIERRVLGDAAAAIARLEGTDWLVLTSAFALRCIALPPARVARTAVVGAATADAARATGLRVELVAEGGAADLWSRLRPLASGRRICHPRSSLAPPAPAWPGVAAESPVVYQTMPRDFDRGAAGRASVAAVTSRSAAEAMRGITLPLATIGPATTAAARRLGLRAWLEAPQPTFEALARAIASHIRPDGPPG